jgi:hypothetical protein
MSKGGGHATERIEIDRRQLALILDALKDAMFYRDSLDHALARKRGGHEATSSDERVHRTKAREYSELASLLMKVYPYQTHGPGRD